MPTPATIARLDTHWAGMFGATTKALYAPGLRVVAHGPALADYQGAYVLRHHAACFVSVPPAYLAFATQAFSGRAVAEVFDRRFLAAVFGGAINQIIGPAYQGYLDAGDFRPVDTLGARQLTYVHIPALTRLEEACVSGEWEASGIDYHRPPLFGCFAGKELVAVATLERRDPFSLSIGVIVHPDYRGRGYGKAVVGEATAYALSQLPIVHYQTLLVNANSIAIAAALGFAEYARTLAARLKPGFSGRL
ncbi:MAG TPA: GNAT family N-acetyltransferase [Ktedonobacterales bacterium]|jgi:GNAT superfamily N-acetyltransferase|nr:GNAT family N-acetyltransferase [Ktedonobacterales bacterium]